MKKASPALYGFTVGLLIVIMIGQLWAVLPMDRSPDVVRPYPGDRGVFFAVQWWFNEIWTVGSGKGWVIAAALLPFGAWAAWRVARQRRRRMLYIYLFYICCGLVVPAKGWLGWAPMGLSIIGYLIVTGEWKILARVDIPTGLLLVFMTGHPWIVAMLGGHHPGWWSRFIVHDHYKRLFSGVHSIDDGAFEYFFRWIGYGLFPWIGLLPAALVRAFGRLRDRGQGYSPATQIRADARLVGPLRLLPVHQVIDQIPPLHPARHPPARHPQRALPRMGARPQRPQRRAAARLRRRPRALGRAGPLPHARRPTVNPRRTWSTSSPTSTTASGPKFTAPEAPRSSTARRGEAAETTTCACGRRPIRLMTWISLSPASSSWPCAASGCAKLRPARRWACRGLVLVVLACKSTCRASRSDWSQKGMWDAYYETAPSTPESEANSAEYTSAADHREPRAHRPRDLPQAWCREPFIAFRTNWRGETFYSANTVIPVPETKNLKPFLEEYRADEGRPFFLFTEKPRVKSELEPALPAWLKGKGKEVYNAGNKFVMLRFEEKKPPEPPPSAPPSAPASGATVVSAPPSGAVAGSAPPSGAAPASAAAEGPPASQPAPAFGPAGGSAGEPETLGSPE
jgi:hypothetical protein